MNVLKPYSTSSYSPTTRSVTAGLSFARVLNRSRDKRRVFV